MWKLEQRSGENSFSQQFSVDDISPDLTRHWADVTASQHLFAGKDLLETNLFELSMKANSDALEKLLAMNKKWDTVIVYPAFGASQPEVEIEY